MAVGLEWVVPFIFVGSVLYSSVGHGGATVYLAILTLAGFAIDPLVTTVLALNVVAAGIAFARFTHAGHLRTRLVWPFLVTSVPMAYVGGLVELPTIVRSQILGALLLLAAARFLLVPKPPDLGVPRSGRMFLVVAPTTGAVLGLLAGATGIGGGIFLSPILIMLGWADVKQAAAVAAIFIVVNSLAGLAARLPRVPFDPIVLLVLAVTVAVGALIGAYLGAERIPRRGLQVVLGIVLVVAGLHALLA